MSTRQNDKLSDRYSAGARLIDAAVEARYVVCVQLYQKAVCSAMRELA